MRPLVAAALIAAPLFAARTETPPAAIGRPEAVIDLRTEEGVRLVNGQWRFSDTRIVASGKTYDYQPKAGAAAFDDSGWERIPATSLESRRGNGKLSFVWYRLNITLPGKVGSLDPTGSTVAFELVLDDYAEIWVNGTLPRVLGQTGGPLIRGWNAPNRVILTRDARPGQQFQLAIFGINGPLSDLPENYIWIRSATLDFYRPARTPESAGRIVRLDPALDAIVPAGARIEKLASGFQFTEGPVWVRDGNYLLFSDPNANTIYRWSPEDGQVSVFRAKSGYTGLDIGEYGQPGSNGLTLDSQGRLTINEHGNRRVTRLEKNGALTVLADRYQGKRLNSPNDLVYKSDGALYFTDPPFGLPKFHDDPRKELPFSGVFRLFEGKLELLSTELTGPNGIAFSPGEESLYVANWDVNKKVILRYPVKAGGALGAGEVFFNMKDAPGEEALDGLKIDQQGNLYVSGPGGVWIISAEGKHLGMIESPELPANFAWGDEDGKTLYMTARTGLYRIRLNVPGIRP